MTTSIKTFPTKTLDCYTSNELKELAELAISEKLEWQKFLKKVKQELARRNK